MASTINHRIGVRSEPGRDDVELQDRDPADQRSVLASYRLMSGPQVEELVDVVGGSRSWRHTSTIERGAVLLRTAQHLRSHKERFATTISSENGKTLREATVEVEKSADFFEYYGGLARAPQGYLLADARPSTYARVLPEPIGLVLAICPWNDPLLTPARKLAPALFAGNHVLLKPARDTPLAALILEEALLAGGLPPDALGVLICSSGTLQDTVLDDTRLAGVTFTGSTEVGTDLRRRLATRNVRLQTEMGGKNAGVVTGDADVARAVEAILAGAFGQAGQRCTATSRLLVTRDIHDELVDALVTGIEGIELGPGSDPATTMGPLITMNHRGDVETHVRSAVAEGAKILSGGSVPDHARLAHGCYFEPTLVAAPDPTMAIWRDEVFGPVLAVHQVDSFDEAIAAANESIYGLAAAVYTTSLETAERAIAELDAGQVSVNLPTSGWDVHEPFGGFKESGSAFKEQGLQGLQFYTRVKTAAIRIR
jgi:acyl-CoA reductase-like NAD-dependent aldehyde dehydrogenase